MVGLDDIIKYTFPLRLLYVEDNEHARESMMNVLEEFFGDVVIASDGQEGLEFFSNNKIDLIITDINMPRLNGLEMIKEIRKIDTEVSILILSAYNESSFFLDSIKLGVDGYLLKPIVISQFMEILKKVTQRIKFKQEAEKNLHLLHQYQEATDLSAIVSKANLAGDITYVNDEFCEISEYTEEELLGKPHSIVRHPDNSGSIFEDMWETIKTKKETWKGIVRNKKKNGDSYYVDTMVKPILNADNEIVEYISLRTDITNIMSPKKQLEDMIDSNDESLLVLMKIDRFDDIEKFYGSRLAQEIEDEFSKYILKEMPIKCEFDRVFILGDGEYAFVKDMQTCKMEMTGVAKNLKELQKIINDEHINIGDIDYDISVLISFAYGKNVFQNARYGLKQILENNQDFILANNLVQKEHVEAQKNLETLQMVQRALKDSRIISYFQPIINNKTKEIEKYESLVRLVDENGKVHSPYFFLDTAKKAKYYYQITNMVLENSFRALQSTDKDISMNISILDIERRLTREKIFELLGANSKDLHRIVFELLEDEDVKDFNLIKSFVAEVKSMGVKIAIDDFGSGYSNFERLLDYQPDLLKIDGTLVKNIENDELSLNLVESMISFAKKQNIALIAEYVENENIFNILKDMGVEYSQGYYFGKPGVLE
ncbi:MAG: EAL domain-containing protein [Sulfurimonas sp.]|nr:EAL domain-containing protein [Sulfurimonas sp.]